MKSLLRTAFIVPAIIFAFQILVSELLTGWTKKYTSPIAWKMSTTLPDMTGKVAIVTGSNTGIGFESALELARVGAHLIIVAARSEIKGNEAVQKIKQEVEGANVQYLPLDLASFDSIKQFADKFHELDIDLNLLLLNAGVMKSPGAQFIGQELQAGFDTTKEGFEYHIGVNHIGHAYLTKLLLDDLKKTAAKKKTSGARIVSVSSMAEGGAPDDGFMFKDWNPIDGTMPNNYEDGVAYGQSKLANYIYAKELSLQLNETGVSVYSCHPGVIKSDLSRYMEKELNKQTEKQGEVVKFLSRLASMAFESTMMDVQTGAMTQLHLATAEQESLVNGAFYHPIGRLVEPSHPLSEDDALRKRLWIETERAFEMGSNYSAWRNWLADNNTYE